MVARVSFEVVYRKCQVL